VKQLTQLIEKSSYDSTCYLLVYLNKMSTESPTSTEQTASTLLRLKKSISAFLDIDENKQIIVIFGLGRRVRVINFEEYSVN
jgi:hypothetical protein